MATRAGASHSAVGHLRHSATARTCGKFPPAFAGSHTPASSPTQQSQPHCRSRAKQSPFHVDNPLGRLPQTDTRATSWGTATATAPVNEQSSGTGSMRDGLVAKAIVSLGNL